MSIMDLVFGKAAEYDETTDPLATPDPRETRDHAFHVHQDTYRYRSLKKASVDAATETQSVRRLLLVIIVILIANKVIDVSFFTGLLQP